MPSNKSTSHYKRHSKASLAWFNKATDLRWASGVIWDAIEDAPHTYSLYASVFAMNAGLSLELAFKAILVESQPPSSTFPQGHNLKKLAEDSHLTKKLDADDLAMLEIYSMYVISVGKYPVATKEESHEKDLNTFKKQFKPLETFKNCKHKFYGPDKNRCPSWDTYEKIWKIVYQEYSGLKEEFKIS